MNPANGDMAKAAFKRVHDPLVMPFSNVRVAARSTRHREYRLLTADTPVLRP